MTAQVCNTDYVYVIVASGPVLHQWPCVPLSQSEGAPYNSQTNSYLQTISLPLLLPEIRFVTFDPVTCGMTVLVLVEVDLNVDTTQTLMTAEGNINNR